MPRGDTLDRTFDRFEFALERVGGYMNSLDRDLRQGADLEIGPMLPLDERLAAWSVGAHVSDDLFANKLAFVALAELPAHDARRAARAGRGLVAAAVGRGAARRPVPDARAGRTSNAQVAEAYAAGRALHRRLQRLHAPRPDARRRGGSFPAGLRLISHWNLRDELKARYADPDGLAAAAADPAR